MISNESKNLQEILALTLNHNINKHKIEKVELAKLLNKSKGYISRITKSPGKLPTPKMMWQIVEILSNNYKINSIEKEIENILEKLEENAEYYDLFLFARFKSENLAFREFLKENTNSVQKNEFKANTC